MPDLQPAGIAAGLHLVAWLPPDLDEAAVVAATAPHGVAINGVSRYRLAATRDAGLIFGYPTLTDHAIGEGVDRLAAAIAEVRADQPIWRSARTTSWG